MAKKDYKKGIYIVSNLLLTKYFKHKGKMEFYNKPDRHHLNQEIRKNIIK